MTASTVQVHRAAPASSDPGFGVSITSAPAGHSSSKQGPAGSNLKHQEIARESFVSPLLRIGIDDW